MLTPINHQAAHLLKTAGDGPDVADDTNEPQTVRCPGYGLPRPTAAGAVVPHPTSRTNPADCWGSGARRQTGAENAADRAVWAQALATGDWIEIVDALRVLALRRRPPSLPEPLLRQPSVTSVDGPAASSGEEGTQPTLFDSPPS